MTFFREIIKGRFFSHPIHAVLIHFPTAFLPTAFLFDLAGFYLRDPNLSIFAIYLFGLGVLSGTVAAIFGILDYLRLNPNHAAWSKASLHGLSNFIWLVCFGVIFGLKVKQLPMVAPATYAELILQGLLVLGLLYSNYLGGDLLFKHKIGLDNSETISKMQS